MEEPWVGEAAESLERMTADPMAGAVRGHATVLEVSDTNGRARYQECRMTLRLEAPDLPTSEVPFEAVFDRRHWPVPGVVLPARISRTHEGVVEVDWERLPSRS